MRKGRFILAWLAVGLIYVSVSEALKVAAKGYTTGLHVVIIVLLGFFGMWLLLYIFRTRPSASTEPVGKASFLRWLGRLVGYMYGIGSVLLGVITLIMNAYQPLTTSQIVISLAFTAFGIWLLRYLLRSEPHSESKKRDEMKSPTDPRQKSDKSSY